MKSTLEIERGSKSGPYERRVTIATCTRGFLPAIGRVLPVMKGKKSANNSQTVSFDHI
jgi:hypothetical protein